MAFLETANQDRPAQRDEKVTQVQTVDTGQLGYPAVKVTVTIQVMTYQVCQADSELISVDCTAPESWANELQKYADRVFRPPPAIYQKGPGENPNLPASVSL